MLTRASFLACASFGALTVTAAVTPHVEQVPPAVAFAQQQARRGPLQEKGPAGKDAPVPIVADELVDDPEKGLKLLLGDQTALSILLTKALNSKVEKDVVNAMALMRRVLRTTEATQLTKLQKSTNPKISATAGFLLAHTGDTAAAARLFSDWKKAEEKPGEDLESWRWAVRHIPLTAATLAELFKAARTEERKEALGLAFETLKNHLDESGAADVKALDTKSKTPEFRLALERRFLHEDRKAMMPAFRPVDRDMPSPRWGSAILLTQGSSISADMTEVVRANADHGLDITFRVMVERDEDDLCMVSEHDCTRGKGTTTRIYIGGRGRAEDKPSNPRVGPVRGKWIVVRYAWMPKSLPDGTNNLHTFNGQAPDNDGTGYFLNVGNQPPKISLTCETGTALVTIGNVRVIDRLP